MRVGKCLSWPAVISAAVLPRRVQIALKPATKGLGMHRIFIRGCGRKQVIADSASERMQVHAWAVWLGANQHHPGFACRTCGTFK